MILYPAISKKGKAQGAQPVLTPAQGNPIPQGQLSIHLTNCSAKQAKFLSQVCALFSDPANDDQRQSLELGLSTISYGKDGELVLFSNPLPGKRPLAGN
jgi:hypothetical protein